MIRSVFHNSIRNNDVGEVQRLIDSGLDVNEKDSLDSAPIHYAVRYNKLDIVNILIKSGADVNIKDSPDQYHARTDKYNGGHSPLSLACYSGYLSMVERLILIPEIDINSQDTSGNTPLHYAAYSNYIDVVYKLLSAGVDTSVKNNLGESPLDVAIERGHDELIIILKQALEEQNPIKEPNVN